MWVYLSVYLACIPRCSKHQKTKSGVLVCIFSLYFMLFETPENKVKYSYISELLDAMCTNGNFHQILVLKVCPIVAQEAVDLFPSLEVCSSLGWTGL